MAPYFHLHETSFHSEQVVEEGMYTENCVPINLISPLKQFFF
jgi:hypothetical protein